MTPEIAYESGVSALLEYYSPLAQTPEGIPATDSAGLSYCLFRAGDDYFAVPLTLVESITSRPEIVDVPGSPPFFLGTLAHGADTIPVIDLAMCDAPLADPQYCLILQLEPAQGGITIAIAVDELVWPTATRGNAHAAEMMFAPFEAASRFIAGRITYRNIVAWALDPTQLSNALFAGIMD